MNYGLAIDARGGRGWHHAIWGVPGGAALNQVLRFAAFGVPPVRWFVQVHAERAGLPARYAWRARARERGPAGALAPAVIDAG